LPQVYETIGSQNIEQVLNRLRASENLERQYERALQSREREQASLRELRTRLYSDLSTPIPNTQYLGSDYREAQPVIPGLADQIGNSNQQLEKARIAQEVNNVELILDQYPEIRQLLTQGIPQRGTAARIKGKQFSPYLQYTDTEQVYSDPIQRAALYDQLRGGGEFDDETAKKLQEAELAYDVRRPCYPSARSSDDVRCRHYS